jgi:hypothetical protein
MLDCVNDSRSGFNRGVEAIDAAKGPIGGLTREGLRLSGLTGEDCRSMGRCWGTIELRLRQRGIGCLARGRRLSNFGG